MSTETFALGALQAPRTIVRHAQGDRHGPITRLISRGDLGRKAPPEAIECLRYR